MEKNRGHRNKAWADKHTGFIELRNNKNERVAVAMVDREDLFRCIMKHKWRLDKETQNVVSGRGGETTTLQRFVRRSKPFLYDKACIAHLDGNPLNNKKENLHYGNLN